MPGHSLKPPTWLVNCAVVLVTLCIALLACELAFRFLDGYRLDRLPLVIRPGHDVDLTKSSLPYAEQLRIDASFNISWYTTEPSNYDRTPKFSLPADWVNAIKNYQP